jgi:hypothetical protein
LGQFEPEGLLESVAKKYGVKTLERSSQSRTAGADIKIVQASGSGKESAESSSSDTALFTYSPSWQNALVLLARLRDSRLVSTEIGSARIGQIVLTEGDLHIFDLPLLQRMFSEPRLMTDFLHSLQNANQERGPRKKKPPVDPKLLGIMKVLPLQVQATIHMDDGTGIWATLSEEGLLQSPTDLFLKYGSTVQGRWSMLGTMDVRPGDDVSAIAGEVSNVADLMRSFDNLSVSLGRPRSKFGLTPLIIFREI